MITNWKNFTFQPSFKSLVISMRFNVIALGNTALCSLNKLMKKWVRWRKTENRNETDAWHFCSIPGICILLRIKYIYSPSWIEAWLTLWVTLWETEMAAVRSLFQMVVHDEHSQRHTIRHTLCHTPRCVIPMLHITQRHQSPCFGLESQRVVTLLVSQ